MKIRKGRKSSVDKACEKSAKSGQTVSIEKRRKIGRFFNPLVRILQYMILVLVVYNTIMYCVGYAIPMIGDMIGGLIPNLVDMDMLAAIMFWVMPYLFASAFLFVGVLSFIKWFNRFLRKHADNLIEKYRLKQESFFETASVDANK